MAAGITSKAGANSGINVSNPHTNAYVNAKFTLNKSNISHVNMQ